MKFNLSVSLLLLFALCGCETLYTGPGYVVHDDAEAMRFAWISFNQGYYPNAEKMANVALGIKPEQEDPYTLLGLSELRINSLKMAIDYLRKADEFKKNEDGAHRGNTLNNLGFAYFRDQQYAKAIEVFEESNQVEPSNIANFGLAICFYKQDNPNAAKERIDLFKDNPRAVNAARSALKYFFIQDNDLEALLN